MLAKRWRMLTGKQGYLALYERFRLDRSREVEIYMRKYYNVAMLQPFLVLVLAMLCVSKAFCAGQTSADFLNIAIGAKNAAMGETGATETGIASIYWNPAGLADVEDKAFSFTHSFWLEGIYYENASYSTRLGDGDSVLGFSVDFLSMDPISKYDNTGVRQGNFTPADRALKLTYATDISATPEKTYAGITLKYITSNIDTLTANSLAFDAGIFFDTIYEDLRFGVVFQNLGQPMKFDRTAYSLPVNLKAGVNYLLTDDLDVSVDINKGIDSDTVFNAGGEYLYAIDDKTGVALRGGYISNAYGLGGSAGVTMGVGLVYQLYTFDYAFVPFGDLTDTHRISIGYRF